MSKRAAHLFFGFAFVVVVASLQPRAEAACQEPLSSRTTYYGYIVDSDGSFYSCTDIIFSPPIAHHWGVVGGQTVDCNGVVSSWGDTSCNNTQTTVHRCPNCQ